MKVNPITIDLSLTPREIFLMEYCINELISITQEMDIKRGFDMNKQGECIRISAQLYHISRLLKGDDLT